jgi:hypothetical protein
MKYIFETGSGTVIYIPSFIKTGCHSIVNGGGETHRHRDSTVIS